MTGLIYKDFLVLNKTIRSYALIIVLYMVLGGLGMFSASFIIAFLAVMIMVLPLSAVAYDDQAGWDRCAMSLPLGRRRVVTARYLFVLVMTLAVAAVGGVGCVVTSLSGRTDAAEAGASLLASMGGGLFMVDILLPLCYKLGAERARPYMYAALFLPMIALFLAYRMGIHVDLSFLDGLEPVDALGCFALIPLAGAALMAVSWLVSCRIVEKKEF